jgi:hypothetical protein
MPRLPLATVVLATALLAGCDMIGNALGIESPEKVAAARDADGKAIGGACRNAGRAIEDCFTLNRKADKAAIFAGWREMNDYMRENKIEPVVPQLTTQLANGGADAGSTAAPGDAQGQPLPATDKPAPKAPEGAKPRKHESTKPHAS